MRTLSTALALVVATVASGAALPARAQPAGPAGGMRKEVRERINMMRMWRLTEALSLDEATAQRFFPLLHRYDEKLLPLHRQQGDLTMRLRAEVDSGRPDPARVGKTIDELLALRKQVAALEEERIREVRKILSPAQQAKLVLLLP